MTSGAVWKVILRFAFPLLIGNLLQQLYNVTDSVIVGQFLGKESLAAVSASFFIYYFIISLVIGIGSGTSVVISLGFSGTKEFDKVTKSLSHSFFIFMVGLEGLLLSIAGIIFCRADVQADEHAGGRDPAGGRLFQDLCRGYVLVRHFQ